MDDLAVAILSGVLNNQSAASGQLLGYLRRCGLLG
jgi:hypothetical protein